MRPNMHRLSMNVVYRKLGPGMAAKKSDPNGPWADPAVCKEHERLWALDGAAYLSADRIAVELSKQFPNAKFTKNAVISRGIRVYGDKYPHRNLRAPGGTHNYQNRKGVSKRRVSQASKSVDSAAATLMGKINGSRQEPPTQADGVRFEAEEGGVLLMKAGDNMCRWPMADSAKGPMCCGAKVTLRKNGRPHSYCLKHANTGSDHAKTLQAASSADRPAWKGRGRGGVVSRFRI